MLMFLVETYPDRRQVVSVLLPSGWAAASQSLRLELLRACASNTDSQLIKTVKAGDIELKFYTTTTRSTASVQKDLQR